MQEIPQQGNSFSDQMRNLVDMHIPREDVAPGETVHKNFVIPPEIKEQPDMPRTAEGWSLARLARQRSDDPRFDATPNDGHHPDVYLFSAGPSSEIEAWKARHANPPAATARTGYDSTIYMSEGRLTKKGELNPDELAPVERHVMKNAKDRGMTLGLPPENVIMQALDYVRGRLGAGDLPYLSDAARVGLDDEMIHEGAPHTEPLPLTMPLGEEITDPTEQ